MNISYRIVEEESDRHGRTVKVCMVRGNETICLPVVSRQELAELGRAVIDYLSRN